MEVKIGARLVPRTGRMKDVTGTVDEIKTGSDYPIFLRFQNGVVLGYKEEELRDDLLTTKELPKTDGFNSIGGGR